MKKYKIQYQENSILKTIVLNESEKDLFPNNIINIKEIRDINIKNIKFFETINKDEVYNLFVELNMILNSDIHLSEAIIILSKSTKKPFSKSLLSSMENALVNGKPIYKSLEIYEKNLDPIIIPFFKILEKKGNSKLLFSSLVHLLKIKMNNKKRLKSSLRYPIIVLCSFLFSLLLIFNFVVPKFETIFLQYEMELPFSTIVLLGLKDFFLEYILFIFIIFLFIYIFFKYFIKKSSKIEYFKDKILLKNIPIVSNMILNYELYNLFVSLNILIKSKYEFHVALDNSRILIRNKYLLDKILKINEHLKNGKSIPFSFGQTEIFDDLIISLLNSGEKSNSLQTSIDKIESIFKDNFQKSIKNLASFIEPVFFIGISLLILWIMLAVFTPIWNMSGMLN